MLFYGGLFSAVSKIPNHPLLPFLHHFSEDGTAEIGFHAMLRIREDAPLFHLVFRVQHQDFLPLKSRQIHDQIRLSQVGTKLIMESREPLGGEDGFLFNEVPFEG